MFNNGFNQYLQSGLYSDLTLIVNNKEYKCHKIIVSYCSEYFSNLLQTIEHHGADIFNQNNLSPPSSPTSSPASSPTISILKTVPLFSSSIFSNLLKEKEINNNNNKSFNLINDETNNFNNKEGNDINSSGGGGSFLLPIQESTNLLPIQQQQPIQQSNIQQPNIQQLSTPINIKKRETILSSSPSSSTSSSTSPLTSSTSPKNPNKRSSISKSITALLSKKSSSSSFKKESEPNSTLSSPTISLSSSTSIQIPYSKSSPPSSTLSPSSSNHIKSRSVDNYSSTSTSKPPLPPISNQHNKSSNSSPSTSTLSIQAPISSSPSFKIPLSFIKQQFLNPKPNLRWDGVRLIIDITIQEEDSIFEKIVTYMYQGKIDINDQNCICILHFANHFLIHSLEKLTSDFIVNHMNGKNVIEWLKKSISYSIDQLIPKCLNVIIKNFKEIININNQNNHQNNNKDNGESSIFSFLPVEMFISILNNSSLSVFTEFTVYQSICLYIESKKSLINQEEIKMLFEQVKFPYLTYQEFLQVVKNPLVPQDLLTEGLMIRLGLQENSTSQILLSKLNHPRLMKRKISGRIFEYSNDFDNKGVLYYLGTNELMTEWINPSMMEEPKIKITSSSIEKGNPTDLAELKPTECWTKDVPSSWFAVDFGNYSLMPKCYTLRHGGNSKMDCLRSWVLQGSDDSIEWTVVSRHVNESFLNQPFATHSWQIPENTLTCRYWRILQTGHSSTNLNFLSISGIEFYGELYNKLMEKGL